MFPVFVVFFIKKVAKSYFHIGGSENQLCSETIFAFAITFSLIFFFFLHGNLCKVTKLIDAGDHVPFIERLAKYQNVDNNDSLVV